MEISEVLRKEQLPSLPAVAIRILQLVDSPTASSADLAREIKNDAAISAQLLRLANSPTFLPAREVTSVDLAVSLLGRKAVASTALTFSLSQHVESAGRLQTEFDHYWKSTILQAVAAEALAGDDRQAGGDYFLLGLLSDIGRLALLSIRQQEYAAICQQANQENLSIVEVEEASYGFSHVTVSVRLVEDWGLPSSVVDGIRRQHVPLDELLESTNENVDAVTSIASTIAELFLGTAPPESATVADVVLSERFGTNTEALLLRTRQKIEELGHIFDVDAADLPSVLEIMTDANRQLANLLLEKRGRSSNSFLMHRNDEGVADPPQMARLIDQNDINECASESLRLGLATDRTTGMLLIEHRQAGNVSNPEIPDRLERTVQEITRAVLSPEDAVARFDSRSFCAVCTVNDLAELASIGERIHQEIALRSAGDANHLVSIGSAAILPGADVSPELLQQLAFFQLDRARSENSSGVEHAVFPEQEPDQLEEDPAEATLSTSASG